ncbi:Hypothetical protein A7982_04140 [Minicystis rosea]|nr:Hypothetical protein A7982_04140 [Minicystis rosea]
MVPPGATMNEPSQPYAELTRWLVEGGAQIDRVRIADDPNAGRGIVAAVPIAAHAPVLRVPRSHVITTETARGTNVGRLVSSIPDHTPGLILAAWLLAESADSTSIHRGYLASLPRAFPTDPLFFTASEVALLEGSYALPLVQTRGTTYAREHAALRERVPAFRDLPIAAFVWARLCASTRVFSLTIDGQKTEALVPLADMLNHHRPASTRWTWDDEADGFVLLATEPIPAGAPVITSYGVKSNVRLLSSYGFAIPDNDAEEAAIPLAIPRGAPLFDRKVALLGGPGRALCVTARTDAAGTRAALSFARIAMATEPELDRLVRPVSPHTENAPLDARNEAAALGLLSEASALALRRFPTSIDHDDALLQSASLTVNARHAVITRLGEKRVLAFYRDLATTVRPYLDLPRHCLARAVRERAVPAGEPARYLATHAAGVAIRRYEEAASFTRARARA